MFPEKVASQCKAYQHTAMKFAVVHANWLFLDHLQVIGIQTIVLSFCYFSQDFTKNLPSVLQIF